MEEKDIQMIGQDEDDRWQSTYQAINAELKRSLDDFREDQKLSRELNSQIVASSRDEDKAALASDEAVAYGLSKLRKGKSQDMEQLLEQAYFARVITEEEGKKIEFRLGTASFPAQRIIDWRKGPISKLYYDYQEGEDFAESIQGRDREGVILLRRSYQGQKNTLNVIETAQGSIYFHDNKWNFDASSLGMSRKPGHDGHLPPILSLITPNQFRMITSDPKSPMIIQGVAGSGKTTVALHRLAWLLHEDNAGISPEKTMVVMLNRSLRNYVETTLPELNIEGVAIRTYYQWINGLLDQIVGPRPRKEERLGHDIELYKSSLDCLSAMDQYVAATPEKDESTAYLEDYFSFLATLAGQQPSLKSKIEHQCQKCFLEITDDTLLLHLIYKRKGYLPTSGIRSSASKMPLLNDLDHIVIDECQDFGPAEIRALFLTLGEEATVTLVGDQAQKIVMGRHFGNWSDFLADIGFKNLKPLELSVSYRNTEEIMQLARVVRNDNSTSTMLTKRHGPVPRLIKAESAELLPHLIGQWVDERIKESTHSLSAVICRSPKDAQNLCDQLRKMGHASVRLGYRDQFTFAPGVIVTNVNQVKGLEFRNVLIVEPSEKHYRSNSEEDRNLLYVGITRAEVLLDFIASEPVTNYLPELESEEEEVDPMSIPKREEEELPLRDPETGENNIY